MIEVVVTYAGGTVDLRADTWSGIVAAFNEHAGAGTRILGIWIRRS